MSAASNMGGMPDSEGGIDLKPANEPPTKPTPITIRGDAKVTQVCKGRVEIYRPRVHRYRARWVVATKDEVFVTDDAGLGLIGLWARVKEIRSLKGPDAVEPVAVARCADGKVCWWHVCDPADGLHVVTKKNNRGTMLARLSLRERLYGSEFGQR